MSWNERRAWAEPDSVLLMNLRRRRIAHFEVRKHHGALLVIHGGCRNWLHSRFSLGDWRDLEKSLPPCDTWHHLTLQFNVMGKGEKSVSKSENYSVHARFMHDSWRFSSALRFFPTPEKKPAMTCDDVFCSPLRRCSSLNARTLLLWTAKKMKRTGSTVSSSGSGMGLSKGSHNSLETLSLRQVAEVEQKLLDELTEVRSAKLSNIFSK